MKITTQQIRQIINEELESVLAERIKIQTVGDLRSALEGAMQVKKKNLAKKHVKSSGQKVGYAIMNALFPLWRAGTAVKSIMDITGMLKAIYKMPDEKRTNTGLDHLNVDDNISAILDDRVETQFIKDYLEFLEGQPDEQRIENVDMTELLINFIKRKYDGTKVEPGK